MARAESGIAAVQSGGGAGDCDAQPGGAEFGDVGQRGTGPGGEGPGEVGQRDPGSGDEGLADVRQRATGPGDERPGDMGQRGTGPGGDGRGDEGQRATGLGHEGPADVGQRDPGQRRPELGGLEQRGPGLGDARRLTDVVARLRRVLRTSIRADYPWESLPMAQVELLQSLAETAPARVGDLAARLRLAPSTVSGLISQMINAGLVERGTDARDRRVAVVALSAAGREQLTEWNAAHRRRIAAALAELDPAERAAIDGALPALARLVEQLAQQRDEA